MRFRISNSSTANRQVLSTVQWLQYLQSEIPVISILFVHFLSCATVSCIGLFYVMSLSLVLLFISTFVCGTPGWDSWATHKQWWIFWSISFALFGETAAQKFETCWRSCRKSNRARNRTWISWIPSLNSKTNLVSLAVLIFQQVCLISASLALASLRDRPQLEIICLKSRLL